VPKTRGPTIGIEGGGKRKRRVMALKKRGRGKPHARRGGGGVWWWGRTNLQDPPRMGWKVEGGAWTEKNEFVF